MPPRWRSMHGPAFTGDTTAALDALAADYDRRVIEAQAGLVPA